MSVIERARAHLSDAPMEQMDVPEWGSGKEPLIIYWRPLTLADQSAIYRADRDGKIPQGDVVVARCLIRKALDASGKNLFDAMDEKALRFEVDAKVAGRISNAILYGAGQAPKPIDDQVDDEKNA